MSCWIRILGPLALLAPLAGSAEAGVGDVSGAAFSFFGHLSPVQTVQYPGDCWYDNGWNGPGYYPCGNEWSSGFGGAVPVAPIIVPAIRRHHRHGVVIAHPESKPTYPSVPSPRVGAGVGVSPNFHPGAATVTPGFASGGFHAGLSGGNFHRFHSAALPHIGAPVSPGFAGAGGFHPGGAIGIPHIGAPVSPGFAGVGGFHPGGAIGTPHIGAPVSPSFAGVGTFHAGGGLGAPRIAPASPGFAGGGFHGVGGAGVFQGGGAAFGQGGIGHR